MFLCLHLLLRAWIQNGGCVVWFNIAMKASLLTWLLYWSKTSNCEDLQNILNGNVSKLLNRARTKYMCMQ